MKKMLLLALFVVTAPLVAELKVLMFAGSTRADSYNKKLVHEAAEMAKQMGAAVTVCELNDFPMPFYDTDLEREQGMPENAKRFRQLMIDHDAILIASPEYNHSISAVLKNTLDWASRSEEGKSSHAAFEGKKFAIMNASTHKKGSVHALAHLRAIIEDIGGEVISQEVAIPRAQNYFAEEVRPENPLLREELELLLMGS